jgi:3',5'-cyclic AMP phosphodiesterase CpdA
MIAHRRGPVLARLARPVGSATTLAVIADPHVTLRAEGTWKVLHRAEERLQSAIANANRLDVDGIVLLGDLRGDEHPKSLERAERIVQKANSPVLGVPGNHDVSHQHPARALERFTERFTPGSVPYCRRIGSVDLVGLNSASNAEGKPVDASGGAVSTDQLRWLDDALPTLDTPIVALHHPVASVANELDELPAEECYRVGNAAALTEVLRAHDVPLVLSGHLHWPVATHLGSTAQVIAPASCSFPQSSLLVHIEPRETTIAMTALTDRAGIEEAYRHARQGGRRSRGLAESVDQGYFEEFPQIDETTRSAAWTHVESRTEGSSERVATESPETKSLEYGQ